MEAQCKRQIQQIQANCARDTASIQSSVQQLKHKITQMEENDSKREEITQALNKQVLTANEQLMAV